MRSTHDELQRVHRRGAQEKDTTLHTSEPSEDNLAYRSELTSPLVSDDLNIASNIQRLVDNRANPIQILEYILQWTGRPPLEPELSDASPPTYRSASPQVEV
jgi:hypothetical protein